MTRAAGQRGFTLIELIVVIVILGAVAAFVAGGFRGSIDMVRQQVALADETSEARRLGSTLSEELRYANGTGAFTTWTARDCGFRTIRGDSVRFTWSGVVGAPLTAKYNTTVDTLSRSVDSLGFAYLDSTSATAGSTNLIRNVTLYLRLSRSGGTLPLKNYVHVRN